MIPTLRIFLIAGLLILDHLAMGYAITGSQQHARQMWHRVGEKMAKSVAAGVGCERFPSIFGTLCDASLFGRWPCYRWSALPPRPDFGIPEDLQLIKAAVPAARSY